MSSNVKWTVGLIVAAIAVIAGTAAITKMTQPEPPPAAVSDSERQERLVRADSPRLTTGPNATLVEFLDFECEACGAMYPTIQQIKQKYGDKITLVVRYMPLHASSVNAAKAAEAAGAQGRYEAMYDMLFQRQTEWAEQKTPEEAKFFAYAEELGLDMAKFRAVYDDPATKAKVEQSKQDGESVGVTGTPTFFLDGQKLANPSASQLMAKVDAAAAS